MPDKDNAIKPGDHVRRIRCDYGALKVGSVYIVETVDGASITLVGVAGDFAVARFSRVTADVDLRAAHAYPGPRTFRPKSDAEADPTGRDAHSPGAKLDQGKASFDYVLGYFPLALAAVNEVADVGARKYTPGGWVTVPDGIKRYGNAGIRHRLARLGGEDTDKDTELLHAAHEAWNALAVLELILKERK